MTKELISTEEMTEYMSRVLNLETINNAYRECNIPQDADNIFMNLGNLLSKYYISTGDSSIESAEKIISMYTNWNGDSMGFFKECYMPFIEEKAAKNLEIESTLNLEDRVKIQAYVMTRNRNNAFYTHCFPGALYDEISENGLDISKEMFKDEYDILSKCFRTSFQVGNLNYCELSAASLSYATKGIPERAKFAIGSNVNQESGESLHDACMRALEKNLANEIKNGTINEEQLEKMKEAGTKIIDFYCTSKSCIAFFKKDSYNPNVSIKEDYKAETEKIIVTKIKSMQVENNKNFIGRMLEEVKIENQKNPGHEIENYQKAFEQIGEFAPEAEDYITKSINNILAENMRNYAISNYEHGGNADGYIIEGGKLSPDKFSIVTITTPSEIASMQHIKKEIPRNETCNKPKKHMQTHKRDANIIRIEELESAFDSITEEMQFPDKIEEIKLENKSIIVGIKENQLYVAKYPCIEKSEEGKILYSMDRRNIDVVLRGNMSELYQEEEKKKAIDEYKLYNPDFDEEYLEDDAIEWQAKKEFDALPEEKKKQMKRNVLMSGDMFSVELKDGDAILKTLNQDGKEQQEYAGEKIYDIHENSSYDKLFKKIRNDKMPLANYHENIYECEYCSEIREKIINEEEKYAEEIDKQFEIANQLYDEAQKAICFVEGGYTKIGKHPEIAEKIKENPIAFKILKVLADKEREENDKGKATYLSAIVRICETCEKEKKEKGELEH